jgi:hypothetical protein
MFIIKGKSIVSPAPVLFYARFANNGIFWIHCTNYWIWKSDDYNTLIKDIRQAAKEEGYFIFDCYNHPVAMSWEKELCAKEKLMFIEIPKK